MSISIKNWIRNKFSFGKNKNSKTTNTSRGQNLNNSSRTSECGKLKIRNNNPSPENVDKSDTISSYNAWQQLKIFQRALNNRNIEGGQVHGKIDHYLNYNLKMINLLDLSEKNTEHPPPVIIPSYRPPPPYRSKESLHLSQI